MIPEPAAPSAGTRTSHPGGWAVLGVALLLSAACDEAFGPISGTYVLREVEGRSVPAEVMVDGQQFTILADTLVLSGNDWRRRSLFLSVGPSGLVLNDFEADGFLTETAEGIVLDFECPDLALCIAPSVFRLAGANIEIERNSYPPVPDLVFEPLR